jgi:hypothetical protein
MLQRVSLAYRFRGWSLAGALLLFGMAHAEEAPASPVPAATIASAPAAGSTLQQLFKRAIECPVGEASAPQIKGFALEPGHEMNPEPDTLQPIVRGSQGGFALAAGTTVYSGGLFKGGTDILVAGLDDDLAPRWATVFGGPLTDMPVSIAATRDGGVAAVSFTRSLWFSTLFRWVAKGDLAVLVSKYAPDGHLQWVQHLNVGGDPGGLSIVAMPAGGIVVGGGATRDGRFPGFLVRFTAGGQVEWARQLGREHESFIGHLAVLADGGLLASGSHRTARESPRDVWVARLDAQAVAVWARSYHGTPGGSAGVAFPLADGGALVIRSPEYQRSSPVSRVAVFAIAPDGRPRWSRVLSFDERVTLSNFAEPSPGRLLLFGGTYASQTVTGPLVVELDAGGKVVDSRAVELASVAARPGFAVYTADQPVSVAPDIAGGYVLFGNLLVVPLDLDSQFQAPGTEMDAQTRSRIRMQVFLLRLGAGVPTGPCTRAVAVESTEQTLDDHVLELTAIDLPASTVVPVPRINLGVNLLR